MQPMKWEPVQRLVTEVLNNQISGEDALQALKPYTKSPIPEEQLYGLTVLDALVVNCPVEILPRLTNKKWRDRIVKTATESMDQAARIAAAQLIANWAHFYKGSDFGIVYQEVGRELKRLAVQLPKPMVPEQIEAATVDYFNRKIPRPSSSGYYKTHRMGPSPSVLPNGFHKGMDFTSTYFRNMAFRGGPTNPPYPPPPASPSPPSVSPCPSPGPYARSVSSMASVDQYSAHAAYAMYSHHDHPRMLNSVNSMPTPNHSSGVGRKPVSSVAGTITPSIGSKPAGKPAYVTGSSTVRSVSTVGRMRSPTPNTARNESDLSGNSDSISTGIGSPKTPTKFEGEKPVATPDPEVPNVDVVSEQVKAMKGDIRQLLEAMAACTRAAQAVRTQKGDNKTLLEKLNAAWIAAERCRAWQEKIQGPGGLLSKDIAQSSLSLLLDVNDMLNAALKRWDTLVSLGLTDMSATASAAGSIADSAPKEWEKFQSEIISQLTDMSAQLQSTVARHDEQARAQELSSLTEQNDILKKGLAEAEAARRAALAAQSAEHQKELTQVKAQAVQRIKELMGDIEELRVTSDKLTRAKSALEDERDKLLKAANESKDEDELLLNRPAPNEERLRQEADQLREEAGRLRQRINEVELQLTQKDEEIKQLHAELLAQRTHFQAADERRRQQLDALQVHVQDAAASRRADAAEAELQTMRLELKKESILRKKAYNELRELKGNIRVIARIRPPSVAGVARGATARSVLELYDQYTVQLLSSEKKSLTSDVMTDKRRQYEYDYCFGPSATQSQVYQETEDLVQSAFDGYNVCVFCYGQTGSGKTYTIMGERDNPGIIYRAVTSLFGRDCTSHRLRVKAHMLELYKDQFLDLLGAHSDAKVRCKTDSDGIVQVEGAKTRSAKSPEDLLRIFEDGCAKRKTASTSMNIASSRSHLIFTIHVQVTSTITGAVAKSKLTFVDLAGSERVFKSGSIHDADRLDEAKAINKSLSALGDVVSALTTGEHFIPYRNHKLTDLMRDSIGGNAKTLMIVNVSPTESDSAESRNSLEYAQRVKQVTNDASRQNESAEVYRLKQLLQRQGDELATLKQKLGDAGEEDGESDASGAAPYRPSFASELGWARNGSRVY